MTNEEFFRIKNFIKTRYGIDMERKKAIIEGRLDNYLASNGWNSYRQYMDAVEADITGQLEKKLVDMLTTNHTYFMREFEHFEYLKNEVLPWIKEKDDGSKDLRIWCAASSSGEEPYTIAMVLNDFFGFEREKWDTTVLATDVSTEMLQKAIAGKYTSDQISDIPEIWRRRYFKNTPESDLYVVKDELKKMVMYRKFNLMDSFPFRHKLHVVFLRNVMIYFDEPTKNKLLKKIYEAIEPGGYLFIGKTETLNRDAIPFKMIQPSIYRKQR